MKLYIAIAHNLYLRDCADSTAHSVVADNRLTDIIDNYLPRGSGFDVCPEISHDGDPHEKFTIAASFHKMDEHGGYDGWADFTITVFAVKSLVSWWDFSIECEEDLEDYIGEIYAEVLDKDFAFKTEHLA